MNKTMNTVRRIIAYLPFISILFIMAMLPFRYTEWQRIAMYSLAVTYLLDYGVNMRWREWRWSFSKLVFAAFCVFALLTPLWQLTDPIKTNLYQVTINDFAPFFFVGIAGFIGMTNTIKMEYVGWVMLSVSVAICAYVGYLATLDALKGYDWWFAFNWFRARNVNTHMVLNLYFNMSLILGAFVLFITSYSRGIKIITVLLMLPICFALFITDGRVGLLTMVIIVIFFLLQYTIRLRRWWIIAGLTVFCVGTGFYLANNDRIQEIFHTKNPRIEQWKESVSMIQERPVVGYGVCSARKEYVQRVLANEYLRNTYVAEEVESNPYYQQNGVVQYDMMHPHNAILESWMRYGIIGLLLCLFCLFGPMCMRLGKYQIYLTLCALAFLIQALFESFGSNLQPLFLASMVLLFYSEHSADSAPSVP